MRLHWNIVSGGLFIFLTILTVASCQETGQTKSPIKVGQKVPDVSISNLDGGAIKLSELRKDKSKSASGIVVLSYWCTSCHSCRHMEEHLAKLAKEYSGKAAIFALDANVGESAQDIRAMLKKSGLALPVALDVGGQTADLFGITRTTTTLVIDGDGVLRFCGQFKAKDGGSAEAALKAVLEGKDVAVRTTDHKG